METTTLQIDKDLNRRLKAFCKERGLLVYFVTNYIVDQYLLKEENGKKD